MPAAEAQSARMVGASSTTPSEVSEYFHRYALNSDWRVVPGAVDGRPALLVFEAPDEATSAYFILLDWRADSVAGIRDFRFARYAMDGAELLEVR
jgi:RNA polymerase sigma-70 factor, ECF subfamily